MVETLIDTFILLTGFVLFSALVVLGGVIVGYYGLKLIDKAEQWYKGDGHSNDNATARKE